MARKTLAELIAEATANFPNNATGDITPTKLRTFLLDLIDSVILDTTGWKDLTSTINDAGVPAASAPTMRAFGPASTPQREEFAFAIGDYCFCQAFHVNHDIKPNGLAFLHVHWSTDGSSTATVKWELTITRAKGHNQANFGAPVVLTVEQAAAGTAWRHMITEVPVGSALTLTEPDELLIVTARRITNGTTNNPDHVFGLMVDFHYETDRDSTPNKAPPFYS
jgi:hypothetical protein